jgi:predicted GNAT family acetyltransferase
VLCAAISYANERSVHEIAALFTPLTHRRMGYAQRVVHRAVQHINSIGKQVRYQVRDDNLTSLNLAKRCGLTPFVELTHYLGVRLT